MLTVALRPIYLCGLANAAAGASIIASAVLTSINVPIIDTAWQGSNPQPMPNRLSRNVSLTPELDRFIETRLEIGEYGNASEVVRTALKLLRDREGIGLDDPFGWLRGRGACVDLMRQQDWAATQLGSPARWSAQLRATVNNVLTARCRSRFFGTALSPAPQT